MNCRKQEEALTGWPYLLLFWALEGIVSGRAWGHCPKNMCSRHSVCLHGSEQSKCSLGGPGLCSQPWKGTALLSGPVSQPLGPRKGQENSCKFLESLTPGQHCTSRFKSGQSRKSRQVPGLEGGVWRGRRQVSRMQGREYSAKLRGCSKAPGPGVAV